MFASCVLFGRVPTGYFDLEDYEQLELTCPSIPGEATTRVLEIHPTAAEVPRNLLRLYVHFSAPMSEGFAATRVHVRRADNGEEIQGALLAMEPELWDPARRRLTLLFDPARIKRGLAPHREIGYPLQIGVAVDAVVDDGFLDADGRPLVTGFCRRYDVGTDERRLVDPHDWGLETPAAGTTAPIFIRLDRPLDAALLQHCLTIVDADGTPVVGRPSVPAGERSWQFAPAVPWERSRHHVLVEPILEDLAGNSLRRVFDRDLLDPRHTPPPSGKAGLAFSPS